ncbi:hypothetical protein [Cohnella lupini]|uniref:DUF2140 family protein n=1 Tax=Cohnella lupini TaxID=1294267 RepID=A0A3D9ISS7_9BACL|nr:hypothetical protein [Cohnella lupini]RED64697.1 hypothetical protein DFP95_102118 [Cohnella lupini]
MKKIVIGLLVVAILVIIAGVGGLYYIKPDKKLDLAYENIPMKDRAYDMLKNLTTELTLTEKDVINLAKKSLAENPRVEKDVTVTGADFDLNEDKLVADLNIVWKNRISAGIQVTYRLQWESPNVVATVEQAKMKGIPLPVSMFSDRVIPIAQDLPDILKIKDLKWGEQEVKVQFQRPTLRDLQQLLG